MADEGASAALRVVLPERLDRRMRLGPFPSIGGALKFAAYAAVGAVAASVVGPSGWLPFVGWGLVAACYLPEGKALDERALDYLAYGMRRLWPDRAAGPPGAGVRSLRWVRACAGARVAIVVAGGIPVAFLPPEEARRLFESYVRVLSGTEGSLYLVAGVAPLRERPIRPPQDRGGGGAADAAARAGYDELVRALARHRARRRVAIALWAPGDALHEEERLERGARRLVDGLLQLGIVARRLEGRALAVEAERLGLVGGAR